MIEATSVRPADRRVGVIMEFTATSGEIVQEPFDINIDTRQFVAEVDIESEPGDGPLIVQRVQREEFAPGPLVLTFGRTPGVGHLLILALQTPGTVTTDMTALGYTRIVGGTLGGAMYYKIAGASEPKTLTISNNAASGYGQGVWAEWEQMHASPVDVFASNPSSGNVTSKSSGTTATTVQENELAVAMFSFGSGTQISGRSWTNGFETSGATRNLTTGIALRGTIGPVETTLSWTSGEKTMNGHVVTFKAAQAAAALPSPRQYFSRFVVLEVETATRPVVENIIPRWRNTITTNWPMT